MSFTVIMDPFEKPPAQLKDLYKQYQKTTADISKDPNILDLRAVSNHAIQAVGSICSDDIISACLEVEGDRDSAHHHLLREVTVDKPVLEHPHMPGGFKRRPNIYSNSG
jgi:hypothetical protein